jgi:flavin-binding protein dodecin
MSDHVYKHIELTGSSRAGIQDAIETALARAAESLRGMHWFEVMDTRGFVENGKVAYWQVTIKVGFTLEEAAAGTVARDSRLPDE